MALLPTAKREQVSLLSQNDYVVATGYDLDSFIEGASVDQFRGERRGALDQSKRTV